ncbi:MAG: nuclear transport factor 2 family protein [Thermoleophilaceae bacterium]|nr:nuclear transport factor 2 family protein [Thermoleophilaceae bacterium]
MSQENVEIVRLMYDAWHRGDFETSLSYFDPEVEWIEPPDNPGGRTRHGHEGVAGAVSTWTGVFDDYRYEVRELIDLGDKVLLTAWHSGRGKTSGAPVSEENFCVFTLRDGRIVKQEMFRQRSQALEAVGLSE